jgi:hypothetical protein
MTSTDTDTVCLNIGPAEKRKRLVFGVLELAATAAVLVVFIVTHQPRTLRLVLFLPWALGALGVFQVLESTCVALAARGVRNLHGAEEPVPDAESAAIRRRARKVYIESVAAAVVVTLLSLLP